MDPLSISAGLLGLVGFSLHTARRVKEFIDGIEGAPQVIRVLSNDVSALYDVLLEFSNTLNDPSFREAFAKSNILVTLQKPLENCADSLEEVTRTIKPFTKPTGEPKTSKWRSIAWTFKDKEVGVLRSQLMAYKSSLDVALSIASLSATNQARADINRRIHGLRRHIDLDEDSVQHPTYTGSEAIGTDPGYALRRYLMEAQMEMQTINGAGSAPQSVDLPSRRTSYVSPEWSSRSLPKADFEHLGNKISREDMADTVKHLIAKNTRGNTPTQSLQGLQSLMSAFTPYELSASPAVASHTFLGPRNLELEGFQNLQMKSSLRQTEQHNNIFELDNTPIDMTERSLIGPFSAWHLPQKRGFGVSLEQLRERDGFCVPVLVQKCVGALRHFALGMTHIYSDSFLERDAGFVVEELVTRFDHNADYVQFREPADFGYNIGSIVAVLKRFLKQLPEPLLSRQLTSDYPFGGEYDVLMIAATIRKVAKCGQETIKDIFLLLNDTWNLISRRSPASALEEVEDLSRTFAKVLAGKSTPLPRQWIETLIVKADLVFEYSSSGYLGRDTFSAQSYLSESYRYKPTVENSDGPGSQSSTLQDQEPTIFVSSSITNVSDDLWAMESFSPPTRIPTRSLD